MGILIAFATFVVGGLAIGAIGGVIAVRTHHMLAAVAGTIVVYYLLVGIPWALLIMEKEGNSLRAFGEAYFALARSLMLLGVVPLLITFAIAAWITR